VFACCEDSGNRTHDLRSEVEGTTTEPHTSSGHLGIKDDRGDMWVWRFQFLLAPRCDFRDQVQDSDLFCVLGHAVGNGVHAVKRRIRKGTVRKKACGWGLVMEREKH
jgi:hypothetical protein